LRSAPHGGQDRGGAAVSVRGAGMHGGLRRPSLDGGPGRGKRVKNGKEKLICSSLMGGTNGRTRADEPRSGPHAPRGAGTRFRHQDRGPRPSFALGAGRLPPPSTSSMSRAVVIGRGARGPLRSAIRRSAHCRRRMQAVICFQRPANPPDVRVGPRLATSVARWGAALLVSGSAASAAPTP